MAPEQQHELSLSLAIGEIELLRKAARAGGHKEISDWARQVLLEAAKAAQPAKPAPPPKKKAPRPQCGCGATASPKGECDLSCIMRY